MAGKITNFLREFKLIFSGLLTIFGIIVFFIGAMGIWFQDIPKDMLGFTTELLEWSPYFLIIGFILLAFGIWYLYSFFRDRKFILEEIKTNKRSEFVKKHAELKSIVKRMPKKYRKMLKDKEKELKIK